MRAFFQCGDERRVATDGMNPAQAPGTQEWEQGGRFRRGNDNHAAKVGGKGEFSEGASPVAGFS